METIEYHTMAEKKREWARGPWDKEPDKLQWQDPQTGLPCLIVRAHHGALCGYVGVPEGHPWHGKEYDNVRWANPAAKENWDYYPDVHGGLTFAGPCSEGKEEDGICHKPGPGEPDNVWWLGFDCAHAGDETPAIAATLRDIGHPRNKALREYEKYRTIDYVKANVTSLAHQATLAMENEQ